MAINNEPKWVDLEVEGEFSGEKYHGRFYLKPYLTHAERADAVRLAERYCRGIEQSATQRMFLTTLAFLKFHVIEADCEWWKDDGLSLVDENPVYKIAEKLSEIQGPKDKKTDEKETPEHG